MLRFKQSLVRPKTLFKRFASTSFEDPELFRTKALVNGKWLSGDDQFPVINPSTSEEISTITNCGVADYNEAIGHAHRAFKKFKETSPRERSQVLYNIYDLMSEHKNDLARLITMENGKTFKDSLTEIDYSASYFRWFAEEAPRIYGHVIPSSSSLRKQIITLRQPLGVVGIMAPWNFPSAMIARKLAPVIATGNACVIKPPHESPMSALALGWLAEQAGLSDGVCNVLPTTHTAAIGEYICSHDQVRKITFTGSTKVGKLLMKQCANGNIIKKVSMELGGNAPFIVFDDADIDKAVNGLISCKFRQLGQTCICANRVFVHESIYGDFATRLVAAIESGFHLGDGFNPKVTHGPLINEGAVQKVSELVEDAKNKGANVLTGGVRASSLGPRFYHPTVLSGVDETMSIFHTEVFGPVASLIGFKSTEEVIERANKTNVGLAGYFYSSNIQTVLDVASELEVGMVGVNSSAISDAAMPFGGIKNSGLGREGSSWGVDDYTDLKSIVLEA
ncbi:Aldedh domain-containing protein [Lachancea thermotolerans]